MKLTRKSMMTEKSNTMEVDISPEQFQGWKDETISLFALPCSESQRHFLVTGMSQKEVDDLREEVSREIALEDA